MREIDQSRNELSPEELKEHLADAISVSNYLNESDAAKFLSKFENSEVDKKKLESILELFQSERVLKAQYILEASENRINYLNHLISKPDDAVHFDNLEEDDLNRFISFANYRSIPNIVEIASNFNMYTLNDQLFEWIGSNKNYALVLSQNKDFCKEISSVLKANGDLLDKLVQLPLNKVVNFVTSFPIGLRKVLRKDLDQILKLLEWKVFSPPLKSTEIDMYIPQIREILMHSDIDVNKQKLIVIERWAFHKGLLPLEYTQEQIISAVKAYNDELEKRTLLPLTDYQDIYRNRQFLAFKNSVGTEIETNPTNEVIADSTLYKLTEAGFSSVGDNYEFSPGYFLDPLTLIAVNSEVLSIMDMENTYWHGLHFNFGTRYPFFLSHITRLQHAAARCYKPTFNSTSRSKDHTLQIYLKNSGENSAESFVAPKHIEPEYEQFDFYHEIKEFCLINWEDFVTFAQESYWIMTSIKPLQYLHAKLLVRPVDITDVDTYHNNLYLQQNLSRLNDPYRKLAQVSLNNLDLLDKGFKAFGVRGIEKKSVDSKLAKKFYKKIDEILKYDKDYYSDPSTTKAEVVTINGIEYSNIVHFSRWLSTKWATESIQIYLDMK